MDADMKRVLRDLGQAIHKSKREGRKPSLLVRSVRSAKDITLRYYACSFHPVKVVILLPCEYRTAPHDDGSIPLTRRIGSSLLPGPGNLMQCVLIPLTIAAL
jgi:hypothetical protein